MKNKLKYFYTNLDNLDLKKFLYKTAMYTLKYKHKNSFNWSVFYYNSSIKYKNNFNKTERSSAKNTNKKNFPEYRSEMIKILNQNNVDIITNRYDLCIDKLIKLNEQSLQIINYFIENKNNLNQKTENKLLYKEIINYLNKNKKIKYTKTITYMIK